MKRLGLVFIGLLCATALTVNAAPEKEKPSAEQKALRKEMISKYDTNKDGKLDKEERAKISKEDKEKMEKAGIGQKKKKE
jgi:hypothetical protein